MDRNVKLLMIPNTITTLNLMFGFLAIIFIIHGKYLFALYLMIACFIFDGLDGRTARLLNAQSEFGLEYDSLSDLISFGLTTTLLIFYSLKFNFVVAFATSFLFLFSGAYRLAIFNVYSRYSNISFFRGLPIPVASLYIFSLTLMINKFNGNFLVIILNVIIIGFLMMSDVPFKSFKKVNNKVAIIALIIAIVLLWFWTIQTTLIITGLFIVYSIIKTLS